MAKSHTTPRLRLKLSNITLIIDLSSWQPTHAPSPSHRLRSMSEEDVDELGCLDFNPYPSGLVGNDVEEATADIQASFDGEYGRIWLDPTSVVEVDGVLDGALMISWPPLIHQRNGASARRSIASSTVIGSHRPRSLFMGTRVLRSRLGRSLIPSYLPACGRQGPSLHAAPPVEGQRLWFRLWRDSGCGSAYGGTVSWAPPLEGQRCVAGTTQGQCFCTPEGMVPVFNQLVDNRVPGPLYSTNRLNTQGVK